ncbi:MAG: 3-hydroxybutyryl-CoA dehydrogenase, partial [Bacteroidia bacterium]|nr:3-hydroxybutyryl-CoA dehydrogenase [Bacteroidia bacterium]
AGHEVIVFDANKESVKKAKENIHKFLNRAVEKNKLTRATADNAFANLKFARSLNAYKDCDIIIEAIVEDINIKQEVFQSLESIVGEHCILASNTSSLSIASIASACNNSSRVIGIHFFNPAVLLPLVEIIPSLLTSENTLKISKDLIDSWGKITVIAKDTPGFIVNRVARPFYGEAIKMYEEGFANIATIDWAMKELGGFKMGPFELMDFIGNDINYKVTETVFAQMFYDPRYKPSITQKRLYEAKLFGRKVGRGYYDYDVQSNNSEAIKDEEIGRGIFKRILYMLINEAADALFLNIANLEDLEVAMTKGVNYPKGLLNWADEIGIDKVLKGMEELQKEYGEDRYRPSPLLKRMARNNNTFASLGNKN